LNGLEVTTAVCATFRFGRVFLVEAAEVSTEAGRISLNDVLRTFLPVLGLVAEFVATCSMDETGVTTGSSASQIS